MASKYFKKALNKSPKYIKKFTSKSFDVIDRIHEILEFKNLNQKKLAQLLGKEESEISKLLGVGHNLTLKTIDKLEAVLDADILITPKKIKVVRQNSLWSSSIKIRIKKIYIYKKLQSKDSRCKIPKIKKSLNNKRNKIRNFTSKSSDVRDRIHEILEFKNLSQKDLAQFLGKEESEISKLLGVEHNLTLKTISKLEAVLDANILITPKKLKVQRKETNIDKELQSKESRCKVRKIIPLNNSRSNRRSFK